MSFVGDHVSVVPDPLGSSALVYKYSVPDSDRPYRGASDPRADLLSSYLLATDGTTYYAGFSVCVPPRQVPAGIVGNAASFVQFAEIKDTATPSSQPLGLGLRARTPNGPNHWVVSLGPNTSRYGSYATVWYSASPLDGEWHNFIWKITTSHGNTNTGSLQMWLDGQPQTFINGSAILAGISTSYDGAPQPLDINFYRSAGTIVDYSPTIYHDSPLIGSTYASVAPTMPGGPWDGAAVSPPVAAAL